MTAVAAACEHADAAGLARLRGLLELMIAEAADAPQHRRIELDLSFHTLICELSGNAYLLRLFSSTQTEMRMIISLIDNVYQDPEMVAAAPAHPGRAGAPRCTGRAGLHEGTSGRCLGARPQPVRLAAWRGGRKPGQQENMKVVYSDKHQLRDPQFFIVRGRSGAATSSPSAARACWRRCGATGTRSSRRPINAAPPARARRNTCDSWKPRTPLAQLPDASDEVVANVHPFPRPAPAPIPNTSSPGRLS